MVDLAEIQAAYYMVAATGVLVAAIYYVYNMKINQRAVQTTLETRQAQLLMQIYDRISNKDFTRDWAELNYFWKWSDNKEYWKKYGTNLEEYPKFQNIATAYEGIGVVLKNKLVDPKLIYGVVRNDPILIWEKFSPPIREYEAESGEPSVYPGFEFLCKEMNRQYELEHGHRFVHRVRHVDDLAGFSVGVSKAS